MPSKAESFGFMAVEAMACGTPVLTFDHTALSETLGHGEAGLLIHEGDIAAMERSILRLKEDQEFSASVSARGLTFARSNYDQDRYFREIVGLYETIRKNNSSRGIAL
jgi:glycosyltransferase involved in cell wall biosynthesis